MYEKSLIIDSLRIIEKSLLHIIDRTSWITTVDDFVCSPTGVDMLDVATIRLMAIGEEIKKIDKRTEGKLLSIYPDVDWKSIMGMRNFIAHAYYHVDAAIIFDTLQNNVQPLLATIQKIISDL